MMRNVATVVALLSLFAPSAYAVDLKIGYVNAAKVIDEAPQGEAALKKLGAEFGPRDKKLIATQNRIKELEEELEKNTLVLKEPERRSREHEIVQLKRELRRATQEFREDYNLRRNEELAALQKIVQKAIQEVARQENFDLILHEGVLYASGKVDITEKILRKLGKKPPQ
ncbi:MAG: OmpH family outer membrane protein [Pseudomonadota bacterium]|nr:MAG: OmpH family outer membrane protein [Pseudomonadota bacterium]